MKVATTLLLVSIAINATLGLDLARLYEKAEEALKTSTEELALAGAQSSHHDKFKTTEL